MEEDADDTGYDSLDVAVSLAVLRAGEDEVRPASCKTHRNIKPGTDWLSTCMHLSHLLILPQEWTNNNISQCYACDCFLPQIWNPHWRQCNDDQLAASFTTSDPPQMPLPSWPKCRSKTRSPGECQGLYNVLILFLYKIVILIVFTKKISANVCSVIFAWMHFPKTVHLLYARSKKCLQPLTRLTNQPVQAYSQVMLILVIVWNKN